MAFVRVCVCVSQYVCAFAFSLSEVERSEQVSQLAREDNDLEIAHQLLIYPATNMRSFNRPSCKEFAKGYLLTSIFSLQGNVAQFH